MTDKASTKEELWDVIATLNQEIGRLQNEIKVLKMRLDFEKQAHEKHANELVRQIDSKL